MRFACRLAALLLSPSITLAADIRPDGVFVQGGAGDPHVGQLAAGAVWDWPWPSRVIGDERFDAQVEVAIGRWRVERPATQESNLQVGITPTLRYTFQPAQRKSWFLEGGIGVNFISPTYRNGGIRFSTEFNFGDHLALGWRNRSGFVQEISLRFQHFSNGGIRTPNPGENFLQLRLTSRLREPD